MKTEQDIKPFAELLESHQLAGLVRDGVDCECNRENAKTHIHIGKKFARVDIGGSGRYMVGLNDGVIYAIKAYGVVHRGHVFGTLDTINDFDWSYYHAVKK